MPSRLLRLGLYCLTSAALLLAIFAAWEGLYVGLIASPEDLRTRYFGGEAMLSHGGPSYRSAGAYLASVTGLAVSLVLIATALLILLWALRPLGDPKAFPWHAFHPRRVLTTGGLALVLLGWTGLADPRHRQTLSLDPDPRPPPSTLPAAAGLAAGISLLLGAVWTVRPWRQVGAG